MFDEICSFENLHSAYLKARKCKRYKKEILKFGFNAEKNLLKLKKRLETQTYKHGGYREFVVNDSKKRTIKAAPFADRVVHHALCNIIEPIFDKTFIFDSYACRKGKGTHKAIKRVKTFLRSLAFAERERERESKNTIRGIYCLQCDISKYFDSINHEILFEILQKKIADKKVLRLIQEIIDSNNFETGKGIPIGNLTSQLFANVYLNELDQFVKRDLKRGYYLRYMDDFLILGTDKRELWQAKDKIAEFLKNGLDLNLHPKKAEVFPARTGIEFLGFRIFAAYAVLRQSTLKRFAKKMKEKKGDEAAAAKAFDSFRAFADKCRSWQTMQNLEAIFLPRRREEKIISHVNAQLQTFSEGLTL
jgi:retron-type reverse transcriptase